MIHRVKPPIFKCYDLRLTSSPFILNATLKHHVTQYANVDPDFVNEVLRSLYVDDFASGSRDVKSALQLSTKVKTRLTDGGFNMRKWTSNSQELVWNHKIFHQMQPVPSGFNYYQKKSPDTVDGSEIPRPTTWDGAKASLVNNRDFNYLSLNWWVYRISSTNSMNLYTFFWCISSMSWKKTAAGSFIDTPQGVKEKGAYDLSPIKRGLKMMAKVDVSEEDTHNMF